jgi:hypothetical protein
LDWEHNGDITWSSVMGTSEGSVRRYSAARWDDHDERS